MHEQPQDINSHIFGDSWKGQMRRDRERGEMEKKGEGRKEEKREEEEERVEGDE